MAALGGDQPSIAHRFNPAYLGAVKHLDTVQPMLKQGRSVQNGLTLAGRCHEAMVYRFIQPRLHEIRPSVAGRCSVGQHDAFMQPTRKASTYPSTFVQDQHIEPVVGQRAGRNGSGDACPDDDDGPVEVHRRAVGVSGVGFHVKAGGVGVHVALTHQPEHRLGRLKGSVKQAMAPVDAAHRGRVAPVQCVGVVHRLGPCKGGFKIGRPERKRLAPRHADVVVQFAVAHQPRLAGVPEWMKPASRSQGSVRGQGRTRVVDG